MVMSEMLEMYTKVRIEGDMPEVCSEIECLLGSFYRNCVENYGEEVADTILVQIGRNAVMSDEERKAEHDRVMEEIGCQDN